MRHLPETGPISDDKLEVLSDVGIVIKNEQIEKIDAFKTLQKEQHRTIELPTPCVAVPGFIDSHTHICYAGSRSEEYALRLSGVSYQEIAANGGGILSTVKETRKATEETLVSNIIKRCTQLTQSGVTTCEVKSGYGLNIKDELKMLRAIKQAASQTPVDLIPTCLAAHVRPFEFSDNGHYLETLVANLFPRLIESNLTNRIDIFIEKGAFSPPEALWYLSQAQDQGFNITCHVDQFSRGGALVAAQLRASSADHLEASSQAEAIALAERGVVATVLPGATLGLGSPFAPARMLLDHGTCLSIASDWNPGTAPMGNLLTQAALIGAAEKLTMAETFAAITLRAAKALKLSDRGLLAQGFRADLAIFSCKKWQDILYHQGSLMPIQPHVQVY